MNNPLLEQITKNLYEIESILKTDTTKKKMGQATLNKKQPTFPSDNTIQRVF